MKSSCELLSPKRTTVLLNPLPSTWLKWETKQISSSLFGPHSHRVLAIGGIDVYLRKVATMRHCHH